MVQVACPYCALQMSDDGGMAGCLVMCPRCGGQMQMPASATTRAPEIMPSQVAGPQFSLPSASRTRPHQRSQKISSNLGLGVVSLGLVAVVVVGSLAFIMAQKHEPKLAANQSQNKKPSKMRDAGPSAVASKPDPQGKVADNKEQSLLSTISAQIDECNVYIRRSEEAETRARTAERSEQFSEASQLFGEAAMWNNKARGVLLSRNQHEYELAQIYLKQGRKAEAVKLFVEIDKSQSGIGDFGKKVREELTQIRGY